MSSVRLVAAAAAAMCVALAGCSAAPDWMPDWMSSKPPSAELQPLRFESDPPGAEVRTTQGQTCLTPCSIAVSSEPQAVTVTKIGFMPQTVQVSTGDPPEHSFWENPPPSLVPNPVQVVLQAVPPPKPIRRPRPHGSVSRARTATKTTPPHTGAANQVDPPPPAAGSAFPPPAEQPAPSAFPPPPGQ